MDPQDLLKPETKAHMRSLVNSILIEQGMTAKNISSDVEISYSAVCSFLNDNRPTGLRSMRKVAQWILMHGYEMEDLTPPATK